MRYIIAFLLLGIFLVISGNLYIYHGHWAMAHTHELFEGKVYEKDDVVIDVLKTIERDKREKIICYRESHRDFYFFILQLACVIVALTTYGVVTKVKLSKRLQKKNTALANSREALDKSNEALLSGIRYAQRLQQGMLPDLAALQTHVRQHVILYKPKDLVSGDFYWVGQNKHQILTCVADSTGHGVPGAFLATLGLNTLRHVAESQQYWHPAQILEQTNRLLCNHLRQTKGIESEEYESDGIEMTILCYNLDVKQISFAGAKGYALWAHAGGLETLRGDRVTLGHCIDAKFTEQVVAVAHADWLLQTTDGFTDQFGGVAGKKMGKATLNNLLLAAYSTGTKPDLQAALAAWQGDTPQVDDMLVLGYQI